MVKDSINYKIRLVSRPSLFIFIWHFIFNNDFFLTYADDLAVSAQGFRRGAHRVRKAMWWKDTRMKIIIGVTIAIIIIIIVFSEE